MHTETFHIELITPCFCGGAEPEQHAEIRAASIRGHLRWWFRTLGGFKSLAGRMTPRQQEDMIFGSVAGNSGIAGKLIVRVHTRTVNAARRDGQELGHANLSDPAYLTFPIQTREKQGKKEGYSGRGVLLPGLGFDLVLTWHGDPEQAADIRALAVVFGHLGSLGFRGRRAMGAIALRDGAVPLRSALPHFRDPDGIAIRSLPACKSEAVAISSLGKWLKQWRAHGQTGRNQAEQRYPGFPNAKSDHDHGTAILADRTHPGPTFRPALGLPIVQHFSKGRGRVNWTENSREGGRFASPVLLRPHRAADDIWHPLVIFVEAHKWQQGKPVYLNGKRRDVSLELYDKMKNDKSLTEFREP